MAVEINVTNRERIFINPLTGERIPRIQRGVYSVEQVRKLDEGGADGGNSQEAEAQENL